MLFNFATAQKFLEHLKAKTNYKDNEENLCNAWSLKCINQLIILPGRKRVMKSTNGPDRPTRAKVYVGLLLLLCGDIEINPAPQ